MSDDRPMVDGKPVPRWLLERDTWQPPTPGGTDSEHIGHTVGHSGGPDRVRPDEPNRA